MTHMRRSFFADAADVQRICPYFPSRKGAKGLKRAFFRENGHFAAFPDCVAEGGDCVAEGGDWVGYVCDSVGYLCR